MVFSGAWESTAEFRACVKEESKLLGEEGSSGREEREERISDFKMLVSMFLKDREVIVIDFFKDLTHGKENEKLIRRWSEIPGKSTQDIDSKGLEEIIKSKVLPK